MVLDVQEKIIIFFCIHIHSDTPVYMDFEASLQNSTIMIDGQAASDNCSRNLYYRNKTRVPVIGTNGTGAVVLIAYIIGIKRYSDNRGYEGVQLVLVTYIIARMSFLI
jgi:hypothetical protein